MSTSPFNQPPTDPRMRLLTLILEGNSEFQVDVTDDSFATVTASGQNVSVLQAPTGIFLIISDIIRDRSNPSARVFVFTPEQWQKLVAFTPLNIASKVVEP